MIIRTPKERGYFSVSNNTAQDANISFEALGMLTYLLSKSDNWVLQPNDLRKRRNGKSTTTGKHKVYRIINELIDAGYLVREIERESGKFTDVTYDVHEVAVPVEERKKETPVSPPLPEKPDTVKPDTENQDIRNDRVVESTEKDTSGDGATEEPEKSPPAVKELTPKQLERETWFKAVRLTFGLGETTAHETLQKYVNLVMGKTPEKDGRNRTNGDWLTYQIQPGLTIDEMREFYVWLGENHKGVTIQKPDTINKYVAMWRDGSKSETDLLDIIFAKHVTIDPSEAITEPRWGEAS